jgi:trans-aconitate methyltransferase
MAENNVKWNSTDYRKNSSAQFGWAMELISRIGAKADSVILDIGCGDGRITRELAHVASEGKVVGIDFSGDMIALAKGSFGDVPNLRFEQMDARKIDLPERFDIAFSNAVLHWIKDQDAFLGSLRKHMAPGGRLHFNCGGKGNAASVYKAAHAVAQSPKWAEFFPPSAHDPSMMPYAFLDEKEYRTLLERHDFIPVEVRLIPRDMEQQGREGLAGWFRTTWMPLTNHVPEARRDAYISEVMDEFLKHHPLVNGKAVVGMMRLDVSARVA